MALLDAPASLRPNSGHARTWTTANAWRATANNTLGMALVRTLPASRAAGVRGRGHPLGRKCIERPAKAMLPLYLLRQQGRDPPAARLGRQSHRLLPVSDASE